MFIVRWGLMYVIGHQCFAYVTLTFQHWNWPENFRNTTTNIQCTDDSAGWPFLWLKYGTLQCAMSNVQCPDGQYNDFGFRISDFECEKWNVQNEIEKQHNRNEWSESKTRSIYKFIEWLKTDEKQMKHGISDKRQHSPIFQTVRPFSSVCVCVWVLYLFHHLLFHFPFVVFPFFVVASFIHFAYCM